MGNFKIVIGSWGSYNECNERSLGSEWLDLSDFSDWEEIEEELTSEGFDLQGIDEELFIQDVEGLPSDCCNWDYMHPKRLFETLRDAKVRSCPYRYETLSAYLEVRSFADFERLVERHGSHWDDDIRLYKGYSYEDVGREMFECIGYELPDELIDFFDFEAYGRYVASDLEEYSEGFIQIYD